MSVVTADTRVSRKKGSSRLLILRHGWEELARERICPAATHISLEVLGHAVFLKELQDVDDLFGGV